ncbi:type IV secretion protein Rhs, partial [Salmonella enterica subsp. enterica serovar Tafo]|nr:type IV secretion protein Rhs [Salmonella enterica subsp. enterica serovar Tafo]
ESGLWYNLHRYMDSRTGQYLSQDPLKLGGGLNTQSYVHNPVGWCDPWGLMDCPSSAEAEIFYRTMSEDNYATLQSTGRMPGTTETTISPTRVFSEAYDGVLVKFNMKSGTQKSLENIGIRDGSKLTEVMYPDMPSPTKTKGWGYNYARFKGEGEQINIGLGKEGGNALKVFNDGIDSYEVVRP